MNDELQLLADSAGGLLRQVLGEASERQPSDGGSVWRALEDAGMTLIGVPEAAGGSGGSLAQAAVVLRVAAQQSAPVPLAETAWLAGWLLSRSGQPVPAGCLAAASDGKGAISVERSVGGWKLHGCLGRVPWARQATRFVLLARHGAGPVVAVLDPGQLQIRQGSNLAGEPRDEVILDNLHVGAGDVLSAPPGLSHDAFWKRGAVIRVVQMAAAAEQVLRIVVDHVNEREQFGRPLGKFQAVQQHVARLAGEANVLETAAQVAVRALDEDTDRTSFAVAAAKAAGSAAAAEAAAIGHQLLGAIGFTVEHRLHLSTTRLWAWRQEFGNDGFWSERLARGALAADAAPIWHQLATA